MTEKASDAKLGPAPANDESQDTIRAFLTKGYGLPDGYFVSRVVRDGGRSTTGLTVFITPPGDGKELTVHYPRESDCRSWATLRGEAASQTKGLTRPVLIVSQATAMAMYEALCSLADNFEAADERGQTWEWVLQLHRVAATTIGSYESYWSLRKLQDHEYSKALVQDPPKDARGKPQRPVPLLLVDEATGTYVTARHMAVFLRHDLGVEDKLDDGRIITRLSQIGGERIEAEQWDKSDRSREHKVTLVLYRLPTEEPE
jgi:hypothetical protein